MANEPDTIQDRYASQFAADLEKNLAQQQELRARLDRLRAEEEWLRSVQGSLPAPKDREDTEGTAQTSAKTPAAPVEAPVPHPRRKEVGTVRHTARASQGAVKKTAGKVAAKRTDKRAAAAKIVAKKTAARAAEPSLGDLLALILAKQPGEPRTAGEVVSELEAVHPERARDINTVRNTLERLVAKSRVARAKQGSTVYYTASQQEGAAVQKADTAAAAGSKATDSPASEEGEKAGV
ncbi:BlaI/MecI/CopY family transcriptional regulator [Streptomyces sp. NPDC001675]